MNKKEALEVLIKYSSLFTDEQKKKLIDRIDIFSEKDIDICGRFLALYKKTAIEHNAEIQKKLETLLLNINKMIHTNVK